MAVNSEMVLVSYSVIASLRAVSEVDFMLISAVSKAVTMFFLYVVNLVNNPVELSSKAFQISFVVLIIVSTLVLMSENEFTIFVLTVLYIVLSLASNPVELLFN